MKNIEPGWSPSIILNIEDVPEDFVPSGQNFEVTHEKTKSPDNSISMAFICLANIGTDHQKNKDILLAVERWAAQENIGQIDKLSEVICDIVDTEWANLIAYMIAAQVHKDRESGDPNPLDASLNAVSVAFTIAAETSELLSNPEEIRDSGITNIDCVINAMSIMSDAYTPVRATYRPVIGFCGDTFTYVNALMFTDLISLVHMATLICLKNNTPIRKCKNCGKFFIPSSRSDEIYCDNLLPNGKTCKSTGYDEKIKGDAILREYRKIYKTQNARKQRNSHVPDIDNRFKKWAVFAKSKLIECQSGDITLDTMIKEISSSSWTNI